MTEEEEGPRLWHARLPSFGSTLEAFAWSRDTCVAALRRAYDNDGCRPERLGFLTACKFFSGYVRCINIHDAGVSGEENECGVAVLIEDIS